MCTRECMCKNKLSVERIFFLKKIKYLIAIQPADAEALLARDPRCCTFSALEGSIPCRQSDRFSVQSVISLSKQTNKHLFVCFFLLCFCF